MSLPRLLVVEDDPEMSEMMVAFLRKSGFMVFPAVNQNEIIKILDAGRIDLILLDVMLGRENGLDICQSLRQEYEVPIILVSALSADDQRMQGYQVGADDYIAKPFNPELLLARVRAVLRRGHRSSSLTYRRNTSIYKFAGWSYDGKKDVVTAPDGFQVTLSKRETGLLKVLLANPHIPLTREEIAESLDVARTDGQALETSEGRSIDVLVGRLRSKIETHPKEPEILRTERGVGYVFSTDVVVTDG
jgi:two-component system OmpR family response regulator